MSKKRKASSHPEDEIRAASANEYTGLMYTPPGDEEERRSYSDIQPILTDPALDMPDGSDRRYVENSPVEF